MFEKINNVVKYFVLCLMFVVTLCLVGCEKKEPPTTISLNSKISNVKVISNEKEYDVPCKIKVIPNRNYFFIAKKDGYDEKWFQLSVAKGKNLKYAIELDKRKTLILIDSNPKGAEVLFNDQVVGSTPCTIKNLSNGDYSLFLNKLGYSQKKVQWSITNGRPKLIKVDLQSNFGTLKITSEPSGAVVKANKKVLGRTPLNQSITNGVYELTLEKAGYAREKIAVRVQAEKTTSRNIEMKLLPGNLIITASRNDAKAIINEKTYNLPLTLNDINSGTYEVTVTADKASPLTKTVEVMPGKTTREKFKLESNTGSIDLLVTTPGVTVYLDDKEIGTVKASEEDPSIAEVFKIKDVAEGTHVIRLFHKLANPTNLRVKVRVNKNVTTYTKKIVVWVANCRLKLKTADEVKVGYLRGRGDDYILFMPAPGITRKVMISDIQSIKKLD
ncbi:PEGA domain-containing protein [Lentisphaerota bacterium WC36G]|nr:PEGA domain-containing protein [Lentisphaerae bacterium WC36]